MGEEGSLTARRSIHTDTLSVSIHKRGVCLYVCVCAGTGLLILVYLISLVPSVVSEERSCQSHSWTSMLPSPVSSCTYEIELIVYNYYFLTFLNYCSH